MGSENSNIDYQKYIKPLIDGIYKIHINYELSSLREKFRNINDDGLKPLEKILYDILELKLEAYLKILTEMKNILDNNLYSICEEYNNNCLYKKYQIEAINPSNLKGFYDKIKSWDNLVLKKVAKVLERYVYKNVTFVDNVNNTIYIFVNPRTDYVLNDFIIKSVYKYDNNIDTIKNALEDYITKHKISILYNLSRELGFSVIYILNKNLIGKIIELNNDIVDKIVAHIYYSTIISLLLVYQYLNFDEMFVNNFVISFNEKIIDSKLNDKSKEKYIYYDSIIKAIDDFISISSNKELYNKKEYYDLLKNVLKEKIKEVLKL